jgi:hypothetical protein
LACAATDTAVQADTLNNRIETQKAFHESSPLFGWAGLGAHLNVHLPDNGNNAVRKPAELGETLDGYQPCGQCATRVVSASS